jgi:acetyl-CoA carboxylase carboxyl transferase subunit beta
VALDRIFRRKRPQQTAENDVPELWTKCSACKANVYNRDLEANCFVCPGCGHHHRLSADDRVRVLLDEGSFQQLSGQVLPLDPLNFNDTEPYVDRLARAQKKTGRPDAILTGTGAIEGQPIVLAVMDFAFSGGSMGSVVGEEISRAAEHAAENGLPLVLVAASGGARMQESALSLMQMAKTTVALEGLARRGLPYVSILTDPTTGGVTASFATIADVIIAEPGALIGDDDGFLMEHGMVDLVTDRREQRALLASLLGTFTGVGLPDLAESSLTSEMSAHEPLDPLPLDPLPVEPGASR